MAISSGAKNISGMSFNDFLSAAKSLAGKLQPHFGFIYAVILLSGITFTVYVISQTLNATTPSNISTTTSQQQNPYSIRFDESTLAKIRAIQDNSGGTPTVTIPDGRINPFAE